MSILEEIKTYELCIGHSGLLSLLDDALEAERDRVYYESILAAIDKDDGDVPTYSVTVGVDGNEFNLDYYHKDLVQYLKDERQ